MKSLMDTTFVVSIYLKFKDPLTKCKHDLYCHVLLCCDKDYLILYKQPKWLMGLLTISAHSLIHFYLLSFSLVSSNHQSKCSMKGRCNKKKLSVKIKTTKINETTIMFFGTLFSSYIHLT